MKLSVLIPVYNEAPTLEEVVRRFVGSPSKEIISSMTAPPTAAAKFSNAWKRKRARDDPLNV